MTATPEATRAARAAEITCLRDYLDLLREQGQCITWPRTVMPEPDILKVALAAKRDAMHAPAIVFDQIRGYPGKRLALNVHGSFANLALLLGRQPGTSIKELFFEMAGRWGADEPLLTRIAPEQAPVHENRVEQNINLYELLPLYRVNQGDGGFFMSKPSVVSRDPADPGNFAKQNIGIYRIQVHGRNLVTIDVVPSHDLGRQIQTAEANDLQLDVAVMLGNHPAMTLFAGTPVGYTESEFAYAAQMMGAPLELTESGNGMDILARSEYVLEATLLNNERRFEGPFGEFLGSYSEVNRSTPFRVTAVSHRTDPIFENLYIGRGWTEMDTLLGLHTCAPLYAELKASFPEIVAVNALYQHGMTAIIAVKNRFAGFAKSVAMRALGTPHGVMYLKNIILVGADVDPFDLNDVIWSLSARVRADDILVLDNMPMVDADPSALAIGKGHHLIIDATGYAPPDEPAGTDRIVTTPVGAEIDELTQLIQSLQRQSS